MAYFFYRVNGMPGAPEFDGRFLASTVQKNETWLVPLDMSPDEFWAAKETEFLARKAQKSQTSEQ
jgi:hypothetical protein